MIYELILILISLGVLIISADQLVSQADIIARRFNFSQVLVGLTVVAFGTSAPELMVSISAALFETPPASDAIIGNVIGSNKPIASAGPIPGSTPTSVPKKVPSKPNIKFVSVSAPTKPFSSDSKLLITIPPKFQMEGSHLIHE